jgi:hypothetical protein
MYSRSGIDAACSYEQWCSVRLLHMLGAMDGHTARTQLTLHTIKLCSTLTTTGASRGDKCAISREWQREDSPSTTETNGTDVKFTFVLTRTAAFNYTSEIVTEWRRSLTERRDVQCVWTLTRHNRFFHLCTFLCSFPSPYCFSFSCGIIFSLTFSSFLFLISSTYSFIHSSQQST